MVIPCGIEDPNGLCPLECFLHSLCSAKGRGEPPQGRTPHFLFETSKRKCAVHGGKEKMSGMSWPLCRSNHPKTEVGRHALPTKLETPLPAALYLFRPELCPRTRKSAAHQCSKQDAPCPSFHCRSPVQLREGFPKAGASPPSPVPGRGFPKGEGRSPRPSCRWGSRAKSKCPGAFLPGCGAGSFPEKNAPHVPAVETVPCGSRELCESARRCRALSL